MAIRLTTYEQSEKIPLLPGENIFHSVELFKVLEQTPGYHPVLLVAFWKNEPIGKLLCITRGSSHLFPLGTKTYVYGTGEYFNLPDSYKPDEVFNEMLTYFTRHLSGGSFLIEFRNLEEPLFGYRYFRQNDYFPIKWLRVRNSLHHDNIDKWMSASRKRQIAKGIHNGATLCTATSDADVKAFFTLLRNYYSPKIYRYLPDQRFFLELFNNFGEQSAGGIFLVKYKGKIIGGSVCLYSGTTAYLLFSCGLRKTYAKLYPGVLAVWQAMEQTAALGFRHFEFIDAGLPFRKFSYRDFILRFGGRQFSSRRWFKVRWNWLNHLLIKLYV